MRDDEGGTDRPFRVVVLGGGTGIGASLEGFKHFDCDVVAIVTVADDGGSSGRLRKDYHMLPPGDIRNCLVALSHGDPLLGELFNYRFTDSILRGHSFGNLFLAVLTSLTGDFRTAVDRARRLLAVKGRVIPSTDTRVVLVASHPDGTKSTGEQCISRCRKPIVGMVLRPEPPPVSEEIREALSEADLVVIGPGSLFTSLVPNLLVPGMNEAIAACPGPVLMVANLMTQPGETDAFDLREHVRVLREVGGLERLDLVITSSTHVPPALAERYSRAGSSVILSPPSGEKIDGVTIEAADISTFTPEGKIRHHGGRLADLIRRLVGPRAVKEARDV